MEDLRRSWEVPAVDHFCRLFREPFSLPVFTIEELETDLISFKDDNIVCKLIVSIINGYYGNSSVTFSSWQEEIKNSLEIWGEDKSAVTLLEESKFDDLSPTLKAHLLYTLCHMRLDAVDIWNLPIPNVDSMSACCIGSDDDKANYWYFQSTRLYKEKIISKSAENNGKRKNSNAVHRSSHGRKITQKVDTNSIDDVGWQLVCRTHEQWDDLVERLAKSQSKINKRLGSSIASDHLPCAEEAFEREAKEIQAKRISDRIAVRRIIEEERKTKEQMEIDRRRRIESQLKSRHGLLQQKLEKRRKADEREHRLRERQQLLDRARRAELRDNRIDPEATPGEEEEEDNHGENNGHHSSFNDVRLQNNLFRLMNDLIIHDDSWPFIEPVDEDYAPKYYEIVKNPMNLNMMEDKLENEEYSSFDGFHDDFCLIISNCLLYNGIYSEFTRMAGNVKRNFYRRCRVYGLSNNRRICSSKANGVNFNCFKRENVDETDDLATDLEDQNIDEMDDRTVDDCSSINLASDSENLDNYDESESSTDLEDFDEVIKIRNFRKMPSPSSIPLHPAVEPSIVKPSNTPLHPAVEPSIVKPSNTPLHPAVAPSIVKPSHPIKYGPANKVSTPTWSYRSVIGSKKDSNPNLSKILNNATGNGQVTVKTIKMSAEKFKEIVNGGNGKLVFNRDGQLSNIVKNLPVVAKGVDNGSTTNDKNEIVAFKVVGGTDGIELGRRSDVIRTIKS